MDKISWKEYVPVVLNIYKSHLSMYLSIDEYRPHILIVEGKTDSDFYWTILDKSIFIDDKCKTLRFFTPKEAIVSNLFGITDAIMATFEGKDYKEELKKIDKNDYRCFLFVTECIRYYEKNIRKFKNFDCYGIIDNDFGHNDEIKGLNNISISKYHDRETCMLRYYLPTLLDDSPNKELAVEYLYEILDTLFKQGVLEKTSFNPKYATDNRTKFFKLLSHQFFKDKSKSIDMRKGKFDFEYYLNNFEKYLYYHKIIKSINPAYLDLFKMKLSDFFSDYRNLLNSKYTFEKDFKEIIRKWIMKKEITEKDSKQLDKVFKYCNGHMIINQMILCGNIVFGFSSSDEFVDKILSIIFKQGNESIIFNTLPFEQYKNHRIKNGIFITIKEK